MAGTPRLSCMDDKIKLTIETEKPFTGRIYVKGSSDDGRCSKSFVDNRNDLRATYEVPLNACGMRRQRQVPLVTSVCNRVIEMERDSNAADGAGGHEHDDHAGRQLP